MYSGSWFYVQGNFKQITVGFDTKKNISLIYTPFEEIWMFVLDKETHYLIFYCMAVTFIVKIDLLI